MTALNFSKVKTRTGIYKRDLIFVYADKLKALKLAASSRSWSDSAIAQLEEKTKDFKLAEKPPYRGITVHFDSGSSAHILPLPEKIKTFDLHSSLQKTFGGIVKSNSEDNYYVDVSALKKDFQKDVIAAVTSLAVLETWTHPKFTKKKEEKKAEKHGTFDFATVLTLAELTDIIDVNAKIAESTNLVRTLADTPSNFLKPDQYREQVRKRAKDQGYGFEFWGIKDLEKLNAGSFLSVTKGDPDDLGGIVHLTYKPKAKSPRKVALVGKGVCFDTGGYNLKTGNYMHGMHRDMTGSAVTLGLFELLVHLKVNYEVHAYLALAENLISPHANRPNDLVYAANGSSIEMVDTDAEGRLILADTLALVSRIKPDLMIDFATLTGSAVRALDTRRAAIFSNNEKLLKAGYEAGEASGERTWGFPIGEDYWSKLKSDFADIRQCSAGSNSDHIYAATFLSHFVEKGIDWIHMDLCCDTNGGGLGLVNSETTGFGVRWGYQLIESFK